MGRPRQITAADSPAPRVRSEAERQAVHRASSLGRGLMVLRAFDIGDVCLGNTVLAERTGLAKATVSRLTQTLTDLGYLRYRGDLGKYELAPSILGLCHSYLGSMPIPNIARPLMLKLAKETKANVGLGVQDGLGMVYVESALGEPMSGRRQRVGFSVPIAKAAMGLACLGGMEDLKREELLRDLRQISSAREFSALSKKIEDAVAQVHTRGFYLGLGTLSPTTNMLGVPYGYDSRGNILAFNCGGSSPLQTAQKLESVGPKLVKLAEKVRHELAVQTSPHSAPG